MSDALVTVPAGDEKHSRTVGESSDNSSSCDTSAGWIDLATGIGIASDSTTITSTSGRRCSGVASSNVRTSIRRRTTSCERAGGVDEISEVVDGSILVVPEGISRVAELSCQLGLQVLGNGEHSHRSDEALVLGGVERLQSVVLDVSDGDVEAIGNSLR